MKKGFALPLVIILAITTLIITAIVYKNLRTPKTETSANTGIVGENWKTKELKTDNFTLIYKIPSDWESSYTLGQIELYMTPRGAKHFQSETIEIIYTLEAQDSWQPISTDHIITKRQGNYVLRAARISPEKIDDTIQEIVSNMNFTYIKEDCGYVIGNVKYTSPINWAKHKSEPCADGIEFVSPYTADGDGYADIFVKAVEQGSNTGNCNDLVPELPNINNIKCGQFKGHKLLTFSTKGGCEGVDCHYHIFLYQDKIYSIRYHFLSNKAKSTYEPAVIEFLDNIQLN